MSDKLPTLVFVPGSWHQPTCYERAIRPLQDTHHFKCVSVTLPSTQDNPQATFKDDIDAARSAITAEITSGNDVIVIAHSYGGMVGNSAVKGLTDPRPQTSSCVKAIVLIASGFTVPGLSFMAPLLNNPPPAWRVDSPSGYAVLVQDPRELFYHDLEPEDAEYWISQLKTQSLKSLFEGGEHAYTGWKDVPVWYIGTVEDRGLPIMLQRVQVGMARGQGAVVHHTELRASHSPFLSIPDEVIRILLEAVDDVCDSAKTIREVRDSSRDGALTTREMVAQIPGVQLLSPFSWFRFGLPLTIGHVLGWGIAGFLSMRRVWNGRA